MAVTALDKRTVLAGLTVDAVLAHFAVAARVGATEVRTRRCPQCGVRSTPAVTINRTTGRWKCHGHGHQGDLLDLVAGFAGLSSATAFPAVLALAAQIGATAPASVPAAAPPMIAPAAPAAELAAAWARLPPVAGAAAALLAARGLAALGDRPALVRGTPTVVLGPTPWWRRVARLLQPSGLVVPTHAFADGTVINLTSRRVAPGTGPKVVALPGVAKTGAGGPRGAFGVWASFAAQPRDVVLVEGLIDYLTATLRFPTHLVLGAEGADLLAGVARVVAPEIAAAGRTLMLVPHRDAAGAAAATAALAAASAAGLVRDRDLHVLDVAPHKDLNDAHVHGARPHAVAAGAPPPAVARRSTVQIDRRDVAPLRLAERYVRAAVLDPAGRPTLLHHAGQWYRHTGGRYEVLAEQELDGDLWRFLDGVRVRAPGDPGEPDRLTPLLVTHERVVGVRRALHTRDLLPRVTVAPPAWLADDPGWAPLATVACPNGIVHLVDGTCAPPTPALWATQRLAVPYEAHAPTPTAWLRFVDEVFAGEAAAIATLQELMGYLLTPDTRRHKLFLLVGPPRSGKGTIGRVLRGLLGADQVAAPSLADLERPFGLATLLGKSLAILGDARLADRRGGGELEARLLSLSGEDALDIARKYLPTVTVVPTARVLIISNQVPAFADVSGALAARFVVLRTRRSFLAREDLTLDAQLRAELPGILQWAIAGWRRLQGAAGFATPASVAADHADLQGLASPVAQFVEAHLRLDPGGAAPVDAVFACWRRWCEATGHRWPGSVQALGRDLRALLGDVELRQRGSGSARARVYHGVTLRA